MKELGTALGVIAGASLLQACGTSDGGASPINVKAKQMLYLPGEMDIYDLDSQSQKSVAGFNDLPYEKQRYSNDSNRPEQNILFQLMSNAHYTRY